MSERADRHPIRLPAEFAVPTRFDTAMFSLRPLTTDFTESDYDAVMETQQRLRSGAPNGWPRPGFTLPSPTRSCRPIQPM